MSYKKLIDGANFFNLRGRNPPSMEEGC